ncbi:MAG: PKD domain-containing protein [Saprospiraceae bacterium]
MLPVTSGGIFSQDPHWILTQAPTVAGPVALNSPVFVIPTNISWDDVQPVPPNPGQPARFISAFTNVSNVAGNTPQSGLAPYVYERTFCICEDNTTITINDSISVDNWAQIFLQGPGIGTQMVTNAASTTAAAFTYPAESDGPFTITLNAGTYQLVVHHRNIQPNTIMGFQMWCEITADKPSLISEACCNSGSFLSGFKWLDINCDGSNGLGEPEPAGWTIELRDGTGALLQTTTTDINGYYSFQVSNSGTYVINEVPQGGWDQGTPTGGSPHTVVVNNPEVISNLDFGNCPCTDVVGANDQPKWSKESESHLLRDIEVYNGQLVALDWNELDILVWNPLLNDWDVRYTHTSAMHELHVNGTTLFFGGIEPGYFLSGNLGLNPPITTILPVGQEIYDYENRGGTLYAGGNFGTSLLATVTPLPAPSPGTLLITPQPWSNPVAPADRAMEIGVDPVSSDIFVLGEFTDAAGNNYITRWQTGGTLSPLGTGLSGIPGNFLSVGYPDLQVYNGMLHVSGDFNGVAGVANTGGYAVYDLGSGSWLPNTGPTGFPRAVYDMDIVNGELYIIGAFQNLLQGAVTATNAVAYDGSFYRDLNFPDFLATCMAYAPGYEYGSDILAVGGEAPFYIGRCGGEPACYVAVPPVSGCVGDPLSFDPYVFLTGTCAWDFGDGNTSTTCQPSHVYSAPGSYPVQFTFDDGADCVETVTTTATVSPALDASFSWSAAGLALMVNPVVTGQQWDWGDGTTNGPIPHVYSSPGIYTVCHTVDNQGCVSDYCTMVTIQTTSTTEPVPDELIRVAPNPTRELVRLLLPVGTRLDALAITDVSGRTESLVVHPGQVVSLADRAPGVYTLHLTINGQAVQRRIVLIP